MALWSRFPSLTWWAHAGAGITHGRLAGAAWVAEKTLTHEEGFRAPTHATALLEGWIARAVICSLVVMCAALLYLSSLRWRFGISEQFAKYARCLQKSFSTQLL